MDTKIICVAPLKIIKDIKPLSTFEQIPTLPKLIYNNLLIKKRFTSN
jgi:hypothetical protein